MTLLLIEVEDADEAAAIVDRLRFSSFKPIMEVDPSVYVVDGKENDEPAIFTNRALAETYGASFLSPRDVHRVTICDEKLGAQMVADLGDDPDDEIGELASWSCPECETINDDENLLCINCGFDSAR